MLLFVNQRLFIYKTKVRVFLYVSHTEQIHYPSPIHLQVHTMITHLRKGIACVCVYIYKCTPLHIEMHLKKETMAET